MTRTGLRYRFVDPHRQFELGCVQDMVTESRRQFFRRSRFPFILQVLHLSVHFSFMLSLFMLCSFLLSKYFTLLVSIMLLFLAFNGTYIISLTIYTLFLNRSILVPFFHPFLHPFFSFMYGFFTPSLHQSMRSTVTLKRPATIRSMNLQAPKDLKDTPEDYTLMQEDLKDISPEHFLVWGETLGYDRGLPHFLLPPEFSEQGVLEPTAGGYVYHTVRIRVFVR